MRTLPIFSSIHAFRGRPPRRRGSAVIEISLLAPWILFLFVGAFDMGFYTYCMVGVENAARVAAEYTSQSSTVAADSSGACTRVLAEMTGMPNVGTQANCNSGGGNTVVVTASSVSGPDSKPATQVDVTYTGNRLIPIPGLLMGQLNITRSIQMRVKP
jgi:Flp pilus assembly protein TadG